MIKLLIVEDELATRQGLLQYVPWRRLGVDAVREAADGLEALHIFSSFHPDIVLTDVKMPGMDGIELGIQLRRANPDLILLFLSSYADKEYLKSAIQLSALDYIEKPVNMEELERHIRRAAALAAEAQSRKSKETAMESVLSESLVLLKERLTLQLIGKAEPHQDRAKLLTLTGKTIPAGCGMATAILLLPGASERTLGLLQEARHRLLEELESKASDYGVNAICGFKDSWHLIFHLYARHLADSRQLVNAVSRLKSLVHEASGEPLQAFTGIGKLVHNPDRLLDSYHSAVVATQRQFYLGYNQITVYEELEPHLHTRNLDNLLLEEFAGYLDAGQEEAASCLIRELCRDLRLHTDTLVNHVKNFFFELLLCLYKAAEGKAIPLGSELGGDDYIWNRIFRFQALHEVESYSLEKLESYFTQLRQKESVGSVTFHIRKLIRLHYADANLSIKTLSDALFLTPNYLSLQFKKETGLTINQYITDYRMERAKELLRDRKRKLYDVALSVGFQDANYFAKSFKKSTGLTPSEYKEKHS
jgi:two-component system, response regulator YesN